MSLNYYINFVFFTQKFFLPFLIEKLIELNIFILKIIFSVKVIDVFETIITDFSSIITGKKDPRLLIEYKFYYKINIGNSKNQFELIDIISSQIILQKQHIEE